MAILIVEARQYQKVGFKLDNNIGQPRQSNTKVKEVVMIERGESWIILIIEYLTKEHLPDEEVDVKRIHGLATPLCHVGR